LLERLFAKAQQTNNTLNWRSSGAQIARVKLHHTILRVEMKAAWSAWKREAEARRVSNAHDILIQMRKQRKSGTDPAHAASTAVPAGRAPDWLVEAEAYLAANAGAPGSEAGPSGLGQGDQRRDAEEWLQQRTSKSTGAPEFATPIFEGPNALARQSSFERRRNEKQHLAKTLEDAGNSGAPLTCAGGATSVQQSWLHQRMNSVEGQETVPGASFASQQDMRNAFSQWKDDAAPASAEGQDKEGAVPSPPPSPPAAAEHAGVGISDGSREGVSTELNVETRKATPAASIGEISVTVDSSQKSPQKSSTQRWLIRLPWVVCLVISVLCIIFTLLAGALGLSDCIELIHACVFTFWISVLQTWLVWDVAYLVACNYLRPVPWARIMWTRPSVGIKDQSAEGNTAGGAEPSSPEPPSDPMAASSTATAETAAAAPSVTPAAAAAAPASGARTITLTRV